MPVIHERSDGEFYIKEKSKRSGQFITWQMNEQCCQYLQKYSLLEDKGKIRGYTVNLFRLLGYVYTNNSGLDEISRVENLRLPADFNLLSNAEKSLIKELKILINSASIGKIKNNKKVDKKASPLLKIEAPSKKPKTQDNSPVGNGPLLAASAHCKDCQRPLAIFEKCCKPTNQQIVVCEICSSEESPESILLHMMQHGHEYCVFCKKFILKGKFQEHFKGHLRRNAVLCLECNERIHKMRIESHIEWHKRTLKDTSSIFYFCGECGEVCRRSQIRMHVNLVHKQKMSKFFLSLGAVSFGDKEIKLYFEKRAEILENRWHLEKPKRAKRTLIETDKPKGLNVFVKKKDENEKTCPICKKRVKKDFYRTHLRISHGVD